MFVVRFHGRGGQGVRRRRAAPSPRPARAAATHRPPDFAERTVPGDAACRIDDKPTLTHEPVQSGRAAQLLDACQEDPFSRSARAIRDRLRC